LSGEGGTRESRLRDGHVTGKRIYVGKRNSRK